MSVIIKSFMGIFFFVLVVFLGVGIIQYQTEVNQASNYQQDVLKELQNSDFSPKVMNACILTGTKNNYDVRIDVSSGDGSHTTYTKNHLASHTPDVVAAYVTVLYKSRLPFLGLETTNSLRGFAR